MKSEIPFGAQFSPNQVELPILLDIILTHAGSRPEIVEAIRRHFFASHAASQQRKLAENVVLALRAYGLLEEDLATPTSTARQLWQVREQKAALYHEFARHILLNLHGIEYIETIKTMQAAGEKITLPTIRKFLAMRGLHVPRGSVHLSSLRLWLEQAGIFGQGSTRYTIDEGRLQAILGVKLDAIAQLSELSEGQRAYLRALVRLSGESPPFVASKVADLAHMLYGVEYNYKQLPKDVLFTLRDLHYITIERQTAGRGAKPYLVYPTERLQKELSEPLLQAAARESQLVPSKFLSLSLSQILEDLSSPSTHVKGQALEWLVIYLSQLLDLRFRKWRLRSAETGGAEVDVIVEGSRLIFSRWQVQAKNTAVVRLDDVAKEVGLALTFLYANVVLVITTGRFTRDTVIYAQHVMRHSNLQIILLGGGDLSRIAEDPTEIVNILNRKAQEAMKVKEETLGIERKEA